jgi:PAS domain S-box-containing protein
VNSRSARPSGNGTAEVLLSAIVDSSDDAIISKDLDGVITSWNKSAERLFGYTAEEAIGQTVAALLIPDDRREEESDILARLRKGERVDHFETVRRRKDGSLLDIFLTISHVKDHQDRIIGASKIARDITQRKKYEKRLVEQARLLELSSDAILVRDGQDRILDWNRSAENVYGFTREEVLGKISHELLRTEFPEPLPEIREILLRDGRWSGELIHTCRAGSRIVTLSRWVPGVRQIRSARTVITSRSIGAF